MATDDAHFKVRDYFGAWVMVKCDENSPSKILESLCLEIIIVHKVLQ